VRVPHSKVSCFFLAVSFAASIYQYSSLQQSSLALVPFTIPDTWICAVTKCFVIKAPPITYLFILQTMQHDADGCFDSEEWQPYVWARQWWLCSQLQLTNRWRLCLSLPRWLHYLSRRPQVLSRLVLSTIHIGMHAHFTLTHSKVGLTATFWVWAVSTFPSKHKVWKVFRENCMTWPVANLVNYSYRLWIAKLACGRGANSQASLSQNGLSMKQVPCCVFTDCYVTAHRCWWMCTLVNKSLSSRLSQR
jgi:hypothetical protein